MTSPRTPQRSLFVRGHRSYGFNSDLDSKNQSPSKRFCSELACVLEALGCACGIDSVLVGDHLRVSRLPLATLISGAEGFGSYPKP